MYLYSFLRINYLAMDATVAFLPLGNDCPRA